jgi:hypothetical protein
MNDLTILVEKPQKLFALITARALVLVLRRQNKITVVFKGAVWNNDDWTICVLYRYRLHEKRYLWARTKPKEGCVISLEKKLPKKVECSVAWDNRRKCIWRSEKRGIVFNSCRNKHWLTVRLCLPLAFKQHVSLRFLWDRRKSSSTPTESPTAKKQEMCQAQFWDSLGCVTRKSY